MERNVLFALMCERSDDAEELHYVLNSFCEVLGIDGDERQRVHSEAEGAVLDALVGVAATHGRVFYRPMDWGQRQV